MISPGLWLCETKTKTALLVSNTLHCNPTRLIFWFPLFGNYCFELTSAKVSNKSKWGLVKCEDIQQVSGSPKAHCCRNESKTENALTSQRQSECISSSEKNERKNCQRIFWMGFLTIVLNHNCALKHMLEKLTNKVKFHNNWLLSSSCQLLCSWWIFFLEYTKKRSL